MPRKSTCVQANTVTKELSLLLWLLGACFYCFSGLVHDQEASAQEALSSSESKSKVSLQALRDKYKGPADVRFEIDFSREHPDLTVPLKFSAKYSLKGQDILWSIFRPFKEESRKLTFAALDLTNASVQDTAKIDKLSIVISAIVGMRWREIFEKFNVKSSEHGLTYLPKSETELSDIVKEISMTFSENLRPKTINLQIREGNQIGIVRWFDFSFKSTEEGVQQ